MNTLVTVISTIIVTLFIYNMSNRLYKRIKHHFKRMSTLETKVFNNVLDFGQNAKAISVLQEKVADLEMYNDRIARFKKGLGAAFQRIAKLEGATLPVDNSFKHFVDDKFKAFHYRLNGLDEVKLIHAHSISKLEKDDTFRSEAIANTLTDHVDRIAKLEKRGKK